MLFGAVQKRSGVLKVLFLLRNRKQTLGVLTVHRRPGASLLVAMYGEKGIELLRELRRAPPHLVPPHNVSGTTLALALHTAPNEQWHCILGCSQGSEAARQQPPTADAQQCRAKGGRAERTRAASRLHDGWQMPFSLTDTAAFALAVSCDCAVAR